MGNWLLYLAIIIMIIKIVFWLRRPKAMKIAGKLINKLNEYSFKNMATGKVVDGNTFRLQANKEGSYIEFICNGQKDIPAVKVSWYIKNELVFYYGGYLDKGLNNDEIEFFAKQWIMQVEKIEKEMNGMTKQEIRDFQEIIKCSSEIIKQERLIDEFKQRYPQKWERLYND